MKLQPQAIAELQPSIARMQELGKTLDEADRCLRKNAAEVPLELLLDHIQFLEGFNRRNLASIDVITNWNDTMSLELLAIFETRISRANEMLSFWRSHTRTRLS